MTTVYRIDDNLFGNGTGIAFVDSKVRRIQFVVDPGFFPYADVVGVAMRGLMFLVMCMERVVSGFVEERMGVRVTGLKE